MSKPQSTLSTTNGKNQSSTDLDVAPKASKLQLDVPKLHSLPSEQQDLYLFTFVLNLEEYIASLSHVGLCSQQSNLLKELLQIINLSSPVPSRVIRNSLGRCLGSILGKGDRKSLYESINQLVAVLSAGKNEKELHSRYAAVHCLGAVYEAAGDSAITLSSLAASSLLRALKLAQNHAGLRAGCYKALRKLVGTVRNSLDEAVAKDIWKSARGAASGDKAALVQASACRCMEGLIRNTYFFDTTSDFEALKTTIWKTCDNSIPTARHAAASCLAAALVKSFSENATGKSTSGPKRNKKSGKNQAPLEDEENAPSRPGSPAMKRNAVKLELNLPDLFGQLSSQYIRSSTTNKARVAITHCYIKILKSLDSGIVQSHYGQIANHLLTEILSSASISHDRHRLLLTRKYVQKILADCIGSQILAESGRLDAAKMLMNNFLKNYPQVVKEIPEPPKQTLVGALDILACLIGSLGSASGSIGDNLQGTLIQLLQHPSYTVQIHAAYCLRVFVSACPHQLIHCAAICMNNVTRELGQLGIGKSSSRQCVGFANGLAAVISVSPLHPLYGSLEISTRILTIATDLLKSSGKAELRVSSTQVQVAWILIGGLMSMGPNFVKIHISQLLLLWRNALPKPLTKENAAQRDLAELSFLTHVRECALGSILCFLECNSRLVTLDVSNRIAALLQNTVEFLDSLPAKQTSDDPSFRVISSFQLWDLAVMVRRRVLQCFTHLINFGPNAGNESLAESKLLTLAVSLFSQPVHSHGSLGSSIANSAANFESIWDTADNSGFGITGLVHGQVLRKFPGEKSIQSGTGWLDDKKLQGEVDESVCYDVATRRQADNFSSQHLFVELESTTRFMFILEVEVALTSYQILRLRRWSTLQYRCSQQYFPYRVQRYKNLSLSN